MAFDTGDLRKPHAEQVEALMEVRDTSLRSAQALEGRLVPGYRVLNASAIPSGARGLLCHRLFNSVEDGFKSEPYEYRKAVHSVGTALAEREETPEVTVLLYAGPMKVNYPGLSQKTLTNVSVGHYTVCSQYTDRISSTWKQYFDKWTSLSVTYLLMQRLLKMVPALVFFGRLLTKD